MPYLHDSDGSVVVDLRPELADARILHCDVDAPVLPHLNIAGTKKRPQ